MICLGTNWQTDCRALMSWLFSLKMLIIYWFFKYSQ